VLVVDDEPLLAKAIGRLLSRDHDVVSLTSAREALRVVKDGSRFDVILSDLMMPQMTGMDLHAELALIAPDQAERMIFFTGGAFTEVAREFLERVRNLRIEKPIDNRALQMLVRDRIG
jgi:CheY-like chemotaxis protein